MNRRIFALALGLGVAAFFAPRIALAEDHLAEAIRHTEEAINHGKQGHADVLVTHAKSALTHAEAAQKGAYNLHVEQARLASEGGDCGRQKSERPRRDSTCFGGAHSPGSGEGEEVERSSFVMAKNAPPLHPRSGRSCAREERTGACDDVAFKAVAANPRA